MYKSISLTDEEIDELLQSFEKSLPNLSDVVSNADWDWDNDVRDDEKPPRVPIFWCSHEWVAVLLINTTKYHCKKCGVKKEDL